MTDKGQAVIDALIVRRSCKDYLPTPVSRETLTELIDIARYSPTGANKNAWRFVAVTNRQILNSLGQIARTCSWLASAQAAIVPIVDPAATRYWLEDSSVAAYQIWLAAEARGLGAAWAAMYQSDNTEESNRRQGIVRGLLNIPANYNVPMIMAIGYRKSPPADKKRPELEEVIAWETFPAVQ